MNHHRANPTGFEPSTTRRKLIVGSGALVVGALAGPALSGAAVAREDELSLAPRYRPLKHFRPDIDLSGKLAVITGASRGNGRGVAEALAARGVDVIGTSRDPAGVPNPPAYPLLQLDVADPASVLAFPGSVAAHPLFGRHGSVDILVNNAGRMVFGRIVPSPADSVLHLAQRELGIRTLYSGHVMLTEVMLPLLPQQGYARIVYTVSAASYYSGATSPGSSYLDVYSAAKVALRTYADNLGGAFRDGGSAIRVSTVNPYVMNTTLAEHPHPIYTQPVNAQGLSDTDPVFNAIATFGRQLLAGGLPTTMIGETYAQLLALSDPDPHVVVASPHEPFRTKGGNAMVEPQILAENERSAIAFTSRD